MPKYCTKCGAVLTEGSVFCEECGAKVISFVMGNNQNKKQGNVFTTMYNTTVIKRIILGIIVAVILIGVRNCDPSENASWAVDEACAEVKSEVYSDYGVVPRVSGKVIYRDGQNYIVVVKYEIPDYDWKASCACLVYGYKENNCHVSRMTTEMSYDYNYKAHLEELKALWALN